MRASRSMNPLPLPLLLLPVLPDVPVAELPDPLLVLPDPVAPAPLPDDPLPVSPARARQPTTVTVPPLACEPLVLEPDVCAALPPPHASVIAATPPSHTVLFFIRSSQCSDPPSVTQGEATSSPTCRAAASVADCDAPQLGVFSEARRACASTSTPTSANRSAPIRSATTPGSCARSRRLTWRPGFTPAIRRCCAIPSGSRKRTALPSVPIPAFPIWSVSAGAS